MTDALIDNPILNRPFDEPGRHFRFDEDGITTDVIESRRVSAYFMPIPGAKRTQQQHFEIEWTQDRIEENRFINEVREKVGQWRKAGHPNVTRVTARLLQHWADERRERRLFFCQLEAVETAIYIAEVASKLGDTWIEKRLAEFAEDANPGLYRIALKMATGSGKTVVMSMLIAWQALNKLHSPRDKRFTDAFLVVTPGITIKDRLRVLLPSDPENYYRSLDLVPPADREKLGRAKIVVTNFHAFQPREKVKASKATKQILSGGNQSPFTESPGEMARRVCRELGTKKQIVVLNDEAHHCYRHRAGDQEAGEDAALKGDERKEAEEREQSARVWISGLEAVAAKVGIKAVYDLSATPFFLRGSGYREGTLFPWVVSDFSLIDAIESGLVKIPRVPVADDSGTTAQPTYRDLWLRVREHLPRRGRAQSMLGQEPKLPIELEGALHSLYGNYEKSFVRWQKGGAAGSTPPVFIVVCNNTSVSKLVFDYVAGWEKQLEGGEKVAVPGELELFSNVQGERFGSRPRTILVDSRQLESGESMSDEFKRVAATEIEEFKSDYRTRFPGRDVDEVTDEDLLREVMNTVGKPGKLGEQVRCVVSVSMLTEGWDANTVTHILGVRAFGTQLLCEQVVGRGLRRRAYIAGEDGRFEPEYAEVYGVPFSYIPTAGGGGEPPPGPRVTRVRALEERSELAIAFPRVVGYRYELSTEQLDAEFGDSSELVLSTRDVPSKTDVEGVVGEASVHTLDDLKARREQEVVFHLARRVVQNHLPDRPWLFPQLTVIARRWMDECLVLKDNTFPQLVLLGRHIDAAADRIYGAIVSADPGEHALLAVLAPYDSTGSTNSVDFDTTKDVMPTDPERCHVSHVAADSGWEHKLTQTLEDMEEVHSYVKNQGLGFTIPYTIDGEEPSCLPDFILRLDDGRGDLLNLVVEVSGAANRHKQAKVQTAQTLWVPGVTTLRAHGRWAYVECSDPWDAKNLIRGVVEAGAVPA
jgi:type III restriction enzyme